MFYVCFKTSLQENFYKSLFTFELNPVLLRLFVSPYLTHVVQLIG